MFCNDVGHRQAPVGGLHSQVLRRERSVALTGGEEPVARSKGTIAVVFEPISGQLGDGDHDEVMLVAEPHKVGHASHAAVVVDDLADHAGGVQVCESRKIDRSLGLASAFQDAARAGAKRKNMAWSRKLFGTTGSVNRGSDRPCSILRRYSRCYVETFRID
jgi:hypothetical protein